MKLIKGDLTGRRTWGRDCEQPAEQRVQKLLSGLFPGLCRGLECSVPHKCVRTDLGCQVLPSSRRNQMWSVEISCDVLCQQVQAGLSRQVTVCDPVLQAEK